MRRGSFASKKKRRYILQDPRILKLIKEIGFKNIEAYLSDVTVFFSNCTRF
jgi:hypothetical protein